MTGYIDLRSYDGPAEIDCEICIAGTGAAGLTLARRLAQRGRRVVLLESGGFSFDGATQGLYRGRGTGIPYFDLTTCRLRYFGGSTNHWGGFCGRFKPLDFEGRPELGLPAWPVSLEEMTPYEDRAAAILGIDRGLFDPLESARAKGLDPALLIDEESEAAHSVNFEQSDARYRQFNERYREEVGALPDTRIFLYANLTHIQMSEDGQTVEHLDVKSLSGKRLTVRPQTAVLACHAIENARLLLASNDVVKAGIGNESDMAGRNFMEHIHVTAGQFIANPAYDSSIYFEDWLKPKGFRKRGYRISVHDPVLRREQMMQYYFGIDPVYDPREEDAGHAISRLVHGFFAPFDRSMADDVGTLLADIGSGARSTLTRFGVGLRQPVSFAIDQRIEQAPNPSSRVTLTEERDVLGVPKIALHWALSDLDYHTFARGQELMVAELSALGLGRFSPAPMTREFIDRNVLGHWHHMGTTRMSPSPREGVVDADCKVHGTKNLYVAGSSVFPTAGATGPTLMIVALALRLAEHIDSEGMT